MPPSITQHDHECEAPGAFERRERERCIADGSIVPDAGLPTPPWVLNEPFLPLDTAVPYAPKGSRQTP